MLHFLPWDAELGVYCSCLHFLLGCGSLCIKVFLKYLKSMLCWVEKRWMTWPLINIQIICPENNLAFAERFGSLSIWTVKEFAINLATFGWIWAECTPVHRKIQLTTSIIIIIKKHQTHAITLPSPCLTEDVVFFKLRPVSLRLHTFLFQLFW